MSDTAAPHAHRTATGLDNRKLGMWAFLGSECLFFGALISTYLLYRTRTGTGPTSKEVYDIPYTSVSSFVLLMSSLTMVLALAAIQRGDHHRLRTWLLATAFLGMTFIAGQVYEFTTFVQEGLTLKTSPFGASFFVLTGFHGAHVTLGIVMLLSLVGMSFAGKLPGEDSIRVELVGLYWHFVDVVWIVIFTVVYLIPSGNWEVMESTHTEESQPVSGHADEGHADSDHGEGHPNELAYVKVAIVLALVTMAEVAVYYISSLQTLLVPLLLVMSAFKFFLVTMWFMHLKFDSKLFRRLFLVGLVLAPAVFAVLIVTLSR
jgi:heme/copper-type cytochrome/quinol oxidase subunit 3